jgi:hypothetical protein
MTQRMLDQRLFASQHYRLHAGDIRLDLPRLAGPGSQCRYAWRSHKCPLRKQCFDDPNARGRNQQFVRNCAFEMPLCLRICRHNFVTHGGKGQVSMITNRVTSDSETPDSYRWHRAAAVGCAVVFFIYAIWAYWLGYSHDRPVDYLSFWAAGRLALNGHAESAYNVIAHKLMEQTGAPIQGWLPFPYPPPFLLFVTPLSALPLWAAFALWVSITSAIYVMGVRKASPFPYSLAHPAVLVNTWIGQTGFLISGIFSFGLQMLERRPILAGMTLGTLVIKPQLGLLIPIALVAGRQWRPIAGAAFSALLLVLVSYIFFGLNTYRAFFHILPWQAQIMAQGKVPWNELASVFASCRLLGATQELSIAIQAMIALTAATLTWRAWALELPTRGPTLAAATLLMTPYLLTYDSLLLIIPMSWFIERKEHPAAVVIIWMLCLLPIISYSGAYRGPNTIPIAATICLWLLYRSPNSAR